MCGRLNVHDAVNFNADILATINNVSSGEAICPTDSNCTRAEPIACCPLSNAFEAATRAYRHLMNGTESKDRTDRQTDDGRIIVLSHSKISQGGGRLSYRIP